MARFGIFIILLISLALPGCGYHLPAGGGGSFPGNARSVNIVPFTNKTFRSNLENIITNAVIDDFARRGIVRVEQTGGAESELTGAIVSYATTPISYTASDTVREYRATMVIEVSLLQKGTPGKVLWKGSVSWYQDFPANTNLALQQNNEDAAILEIGKRIAQELYFKMTEDF